MSICEVNQSITSDFPHKEPARNVTLCFYMIFAVNLNNLSCWKHSGIAGDLRRHDIRVTGSLHAPRTAEDMAIEYTYSCVLRILKRDDSHNAHILL